MGRKAAKNRYGVQVGDIFTQAYSYEDFDGYYFYQVIALRGETQVVVRRIMESMVAFDGHCEQVVPVPDAWVSDEAPIRRVFDGFGSMNRINICIEKGWNGFAYLDNLDSEKIHLKRRRNAPCIPYWFSESNPEIAKQLDLEKGSGVYAADRSFAGMEDGCRVIIRYPDGREEEAILDELLKRETIRVWGIIR